MAFAVLTKPTATAADPIDRWAPEIARASARFGIPDRWIRRVMRAESRGRIMLGGRPIVSRAGAMGLMQLMPGTWREMRRALGLGPDPHDPADNIAAGALYLRQMYDRFGYPGLFAAYNAGPARYAAFLSGRRALPAETRAYVAAVALPEPRAHLATVADPALREVSPMLATRAHSATAPAGPGRSSADALHPSSTGLFVALERPVPR